MVSWDPELYLRFGQARLRPALELLARVPHRRPAMVVDLGCGTGAAAPHLQGRWPDAEIVGVDQAPEMLAVARRDHPHLTWVEEDIAHWQPSAPVDVIYSNSALHWLDEHDGLFPRLAGLLARGGALAVQMPRNQDAPYQAALAEVVGRRRWRSALGHRLRAWPVGEPGFYYDLLAPALAALDVWETEYLQLLTGDNPVADWARGSLLRPLLSALPPDEAEAFFADYAAEIRQAYQPGPDGVTRFPFRRLFLVGQAR